MQKYCLFKDCKKPSDHHNTAGHPCGSCGIPGHSRALCGQAKEIAEVLAADGRGISVCRLCKSATHLTGHHGCGKCGALGHSEAYCRISKRGMDPWHQAVLLSVGDYLPRNKWCGVADCTVSHMHASVDHPCDDCGYRKCPGTSLHFPVTCPMCRADCRVTKDKLLPDEDAEEQECDICYETDQQCYLPCGHCVCSDCLDKLLSSKARASIEREYGEDASAMDRENSVNIEELVRSQFDAHMASKSKIYMLFRHNLGGENSQEQESVWIHASRDTEGSTIDLIAYQNISNIETANLHRRMKTAGYALVE